MILDININVINERIEIKTKHIEPSDSLNYIKCKFHFLTNDWDGLDARIAIFKNSSYNVEEQMLISSVDNSCYVPPTVFEHPGVIQVSVRGNKYQGGLVVFRIDTGITEFLLDKDSVIAGSGISDLTPSKYEAFLADFNAKAQAWFDKFNIEILTSKSWAVGGTGLRPGEDTNNSRYWSEQAEGRVYEATTKADEAEEFALLSEQYAKGTRNGTPVSSEDSGYHDNAYYYKEQAREYSEEVAGYVGSIEQAVSDAEAYAHTAETEAYAAAQSATSAATSASSVLGLTADSEVLAPGSTPTVEIALDDDHYNLHFGLVRGVKGDKGDPGPKGDPGTSIWGNISGELQDQADLAEVLTNIEDKIKDIELFKFPNATIIGQPQIESGQVSEFSIEDYLIFPFVVDVRNRIFEIQMCFTTGSDVTSQQNILDSEFGLALAIQNGRGIMALSSNGTSWDIGLATGGYSILPNHTYYAKVSWDGQVYKTSISVDGVSYVDDMQIVSDTGLYPRPVYIGGSPGLFGPGSAHIFSGTINLNNCQLLIFGRLIWSGMDDAGLATRADVSLSNLDPEGVKRVQDISALTSSIFWCNDDTTYDEIVEAYESGQLPCYAVAHYVFVLGYITTLAALFHTNRSGKTFTTACFKDSGWTGIDAYEFVYLDTFIEELATKVDDVKVNGTSIVNNGVANLTYTKTDGEFGLFGTHYGGGLARTNNLIHIRPATNTSIDSRFTLPASSNTHAGVIIPSNLDYAVKRAMCDPIGTKPNTTNPLNIAWTDTEKTNAQIRIGIVVLTQEEYNLIDAPSESTIYIIKG